MSVTSVVKVHVCMCVCLVCVKDVRWLANITPNVRWAQVLPTRSAPPPGRLPAALKKQSRIDLPEDCHNEFAYIFPYGQKCMEIPVHI